MGRLRPSWIGCGARCRRQQPGVGKSLSRLPLVDAFGGTLAVQQVCLPELTIDYNFAQVAHCDRCTTCHLAMSPGAGQGAAAPALGPEQVLTLQLATPAAPKPLRQNKLTNLGGTPGGTTGVAGPQITPFAALRDVPPFAGEGGGPLESAYGFAFAPTGILEPAAVTVGLVRAQSPAARAMLEPGDVLLAIDGRPVSDIVAATRYLLEEVPWGRAVQLQVCRGVPHPYRSHPRPDLFVGSASPHPAATFGCTICHEGQGSATDFTWAGHTPNEPARRPRGAGEHGWRCNPDWEYPMLARRFAESRCLQCHPQLTDLEPSRRFPDPPAPKLLAGYHLVRNWAVSAAMRSARWTRNAKRGTRNSERNVGEGPGVAVTPLSRLRERGRG